MDCDISIKQINELETRLEKSIDYAEYFHRLYEETNLSKFETISENMYGCSKQWFFDEYVNNAVLDFKTVFCCHNKFCLNCQKLLQEQRLIKFRPIIEKFGSQYYLYHATLTLENIVVDSNVLKEILDRLFRVLQFVIKYLKGQNKITGISFPTGYEGCIRSFEIVKNNDTNLLHPHLHVIFAFSKEIDLVRKKSNRNAFSYRQGKFDRDFSDFEILLQKICYLIMHKERVTATSIAKLDRGYSGIVDKMPAGDFYEVFKYAIKIDSKVFDYNTFKALYYGLYRRKLLQGYGCFYNLKFDDTIDRDTINIIYNDYIKALRATEMPQATSLTLNAFKQELVLQEKKFINRRKFFNFGSDVIAKMYDGVSDTDKQAYFVNKENLKLAKEKLKKDNQFLPTIKGAIADSKINNKSPVIFTADVDLYNLNIDSKIRLEVIKNAITSAHHNLEHDKIVAKYTKYDETFHIALALTKSDTDAIRQEFITYLKINEKIDISKTDSKQVSLFDIAYNNSYGKALLYCPADEEEDDFIQSMSAFAEHHL